MLSSQEIEAHIHVISTALEALEGAGQDLSGSVEIAERFGALREQYRSQPDSMAEHVSELTQLRRRFDDLLAQRLALVVDRFEELNEQIHLREEEKAFWRDFLIRQAAQTRQEYFDGVAATVRVRSIQSRTLPPVGAGERKRLEELVSASGCWDQVSQLSRPKLERALAGNLFAGGEAEEIDQLCPSTVRHQVSCYAREG